VELEIQDFLTLALDGGKWVFSRPERFILGKRAQVTHSTGGLLGLTVGLDSVEKMKPQILQDENRLPLLGIEPRFISFSVRNLGSILMEISRLICNN
jgi:hypothetical protein